MSFVGVFLYTSKTTTQPIIGLGFFLSKRPDLELEPCRRTCLKFKSSVPHQKSSFTELGSEVSIRGENGTDELERK